MSYFAWDMDWDIEAEGRWGMWVLARSHLPGCGDKKNIAWSNREDAKVKISMGLDKELVILYTNLDISNFIY